MNAKSKRPPLLDDSFDLNSIMVKPGTPAREPEADDEAAPAEPAAAKAKPAKAPPVTEMFRTSHYFSRAVHDKLREIAFAERRTVADLMNEGIDHVLASRNYATAAELRSKKR